MRRNNLDYDLKTVAPKKTEEHLLINMAPRVAFPSKPTPWHRPSSKTNVKPKKVFAKNTKIKLPVVFEETERCHLRFYARLTTNYRDLGNCLFEQLTLV